MTENLMPKLSLIVPCYNEEATLSDIVERVLRLRSDRLALEIVLVDDCSTDNSRAIAEELEKRGITLSRRTVAKYRSQMEIDSSFRRSGDKK